MRHSNSNWIRQFSINRFERSQNFTSFVLTFKSQLKKLDHYRNDCKDDITLHSLWGHSITNWERQFSIEMISNMKEPYIFCWDIQILIEIDSSVLKWLKKWQNLTFFVGTFKSQLKNTDYYWNDYKDDRPLHSFLGHSSFKWKKLASFIGTFKIQLEKQFSIIMISKMTEPYIICGDTQIPTEKDSSALTWFQRSHSFTSFEGRFRSQLRKTV